VIGVHHSAICTSDVELALRFWRDGLGLQQLFDHNFTGNWPELFGADGDRLRSIFLGDPQSPDSGIVELVQLPGADAQLPAVPRPRHGFFLLSLQRDVEPTLSALAAQGFADNVRRITVPGPGGKTVAMAVVTAPDGVLVELVGPPS
jgi:catechol 2,3-dioxygenase-like lactoylglutathione lyase family enzyme